MLQPAAGQPTPHRRVRASATYWSRISGSRLPRARPYPAKYKNLVPNDGPRWLTRFPPSPCRYSCALTGPSSCSIRTAPVSRAPISSASLPKTRSRRARPSPCVPVPQMAAATRACVAPSGCAARSATWKTVRRSRRGQRPGPGDGSLSSSGGHKSRRGSRSRQLSGLNGTDRVPVPTGPCPAASPGTAAGTRGPERRAGARRRSAYGRCRALAPGQRCRDQHRARRAGTGRRPQRPAARSGRGGLAAVGRDDTAGAASGGTWPMSGTSGCSARSPTSRPAPSRSPISPGAARGG